MLLSGMNQEGYHLELLKLIIELFAKSPIAGSVVGIAVLFFFVYMTIRNKKQLWELYKKLAGEAVSNTGKDQNTTDSVHNDINDFIGDDNESGTSG